jgi:hypothetical protein
MPKAGGQSFAAAVSYAEGVAPTDNQHLATKKYVDSAVAGLTGGLYATKEYVDQQDGILDGKITNAQNTANTANATADRAEGKADTNAQLIGSLGSKGTTVVGYIDSVKEIADKAAVAEIVNGQINGLDTKITNTNTALEGVKGTAEAAMPKAGGAFTGAVSGIAPTENAHLTTKSYVDGAIGGAKTELIGGATNKTLKAIEDAHAADKATIDS